MLKDSFGRIHTYLRISLTDACNLRCAYCMPAEHSYAPEHTRTLAASEVIALAKTFSSLGINKIRLTGGEPLLRKDLDEILKGLSTLPLQVVISTNGVLLNKHLQMLKDYGVNQLNISLDSRNEQKFMGMTGMNLFHTVNRNINEAVSAGFRIKLNTVLMKGKNDGDAIELAELTRMNPIQVRFIEYMPFEGNHWNLSQLISGEELLNILAGKFDLEKVPDQPSDTDRKYRIKGSPGSIGFINTMSQPFCAGCNRLRITPDGKLRNCLFARNETDLLGPLRAGEPLEPMIIQCLLGKKEKTGGRDLLHEAENRSMIRIGG